MKPTEYETAVLRRIARTGGMMLTKSEDGWCYSDRSGGTIDKRVARKLIDNRFVLAERDSMFGTEPQSWVTRKP